MKNFIMAVLIAAAGSSTNAQSMKEIAAEKYRPQVHFTPPAHWMNDPNGMVYYQGTWHLFYQYYPEATVWGPMHWGHATSTDLVHWKHQPIAIYPDSLGYIFSGSAVVDAQNTSGFGSKAHPPLVAIYTSHDPVGEQKNTNTFQTQSISYSTDGGKTWTKYAHNPVLPNPGIRDFRDPKVSWFAPAGKWIMTMASQDKVSFYSSPNLKEWKHESDFGKTVGSHGGVWECPDLLTLPFEGKTYHVLLSSINPGGPNGGSATQYFVGHFDGHAFTPADTITRWIDYGPDDYAGVTWSNTGSRKIFLGWMSNWQYARDVPTEKWRSANTVPRDLQLAKNKQGFILLSKPAAELQKLVTTVKTFTGSGDVEIPGNITAGILELSQKKQAAYTVTISNTENEKVVIGYDAAKQEYFIDRTQSGQTNFHTAFASKATAPALHDKAGRNATIIIDQSSIELFADDGATVLTALVFPNKPFNKIQMRCSAKNNFQKITYKKLKSMYE